ncbi:hypothetical protein [Hydrogenimonas sp.]
MKKRKPIKPRITWGFDPVSRIVPSKKGYRRSRAKASARKECLDG